MPLRPVLRPGHDVVRRDASTLLVGPPPSLPLPDEPGLVEVLRLLDGHTLDEVVSRARTTTYAGDVHRLVERLVGAGVVGDAAPAPRPRLCVRVQPAPGAAALATTVARAVDDLGLATDDERAALVLVSCDEPTRPWLEHALALGVPTLPVVAVDGAVRVGPFSLPGRAPCLACHDAERCEWDPVWRARLAQAGRPLVRAAPARPPVPLQWESAALAAAEVDALARGGRPVTVGATLTLDGTTRRRRAVAFHPRCACSLVTGP